MATWQGEYYDPDLSITEIAAIIRADLKKTFPAYRFSVDSRKKREIIISLLEYPVELTNKTLIASYFLMMEDDFMFYDVRRGTFRYKRDITPTETERLIDDLYKYAGLYVRITKYDTWLNPEILDVLCLFKNSWTRITEKVKFIEMYYFTIASISARSILDVEINMHKLFRAPLLAGGFRSLNEQRRSRLENETHAHYSN